MATTTLEIVLQARDEASASLKSLQASATSLGKEFTIAGGLITGALGLAVKAAADAEQQVAKTNAITKTLGDVAKKAGIDTAHLAEQFTKVGDSAVKLGFDNEAVSLSMAQLTKSTGDVAVGQRAVGLAMDFARARNLDLESATRLVNLALQGSPKILTSYGIALDQAATKTDILDALTTAFGGTAKETVNTLAVQTQVLNETFGNLVEEIGAVFLPIIAQAIKQVTPFIEKIIEWTKTHPELTKEILLAVGALGILLTVLGPILLIIGTLSSGMIAAGIVIAGLGFGILTLIQNWDAVKAAMEPVLFQIKEIALTVADFLRPAIEFLIVQLIGLWAQLKILWDLLSPILIPALQILAVLLGSTIVAAIAILIGAIAIIAGTLSAFIAKISEVINRLADLIIWFQTTIPKALQFLSDTWNAIWDGIKSKTEAVVNFILDKVQAAINAFESAKKVAAAPIEAAKAVGSTVAGAAKSTFNAAKNLLGFAEGGVITKPLIGMLGEAGPEAVIPLNKFAGLGGGTNITVNINGTFMGDEDMAVHIGNLIVKRLSMVTRLGL